MRIVTTILPLAAAACAGPVADAPSLARRPAEGRGFAEPVRAEPVVTQNPALDARIGERTAAFDAAVARFERQRAALAPRIAAGARAREGSDAWIAGQAATGELGQARASVDAALADIEELGIARAAGNAPPYPRLDAALAAAQARRDALPR